MDLKTGTTYNAANNVAGTIEAHFRKHLIAAKANSEDELATVPCKG